jgi:hypothetical protein
MTRFLLLLAALLVLANCASTGPVPMGQNLYTISKTSPACGFRDAGGVKADLFAEMTSFCKASNLYPEVKTIEALDGVIGRRCASATVEFRCVTEGHADFSPTGQPPDRDMNRNPHIPSDRGQFGRKASDPITIKQDARVGATNDIYVELKRLKELLDTGIITQQEFDARKQKILAQ